MCSTSETSTPGYTDALRAALDAAGFETTKLVASDVVDFGIYTEMAANRTLHAAVDVIGVHHMHSSPPCRRDRKVRDACRCFGPAALAQGPGEEASGAVVQRGWPCLGSTIRGRTGTVLQTAGAKTYADFLSASLRLQGQSATILCPAINDLMLNVGETLHGFIWAHEPHSGHYSVGAGLWVGAHWSHHTERGWWYIGGSVAHGGALPPPPPPPLPPTTKRACAYKRLHTF